MSAMQTILDLMGRNVSDATLQFIAPGGTWSLGRGEPRVTIRLRGADVLRRILRNPGLAFGETYMDGDWQPEGGELLPVLRACLAISRTWDRNPLVRYRGLARSLLLELNTAPRSRRNASHHYDIEPALYARFLDADLHYSCAYFSEPGMSLEAAQQAKCAHIAAKLDLKHGARVLDIGCGWGSLAMYLAERHGARVTGVTLSEQQLIRARERARERGLEGQVDFRLEDYRKIRGTFDAVVSVGMFEHVGRPQYGTFFQCVRGRLNSDGTALLHTIGRAAPPDSANPWIEKHIFPGSYIPAASEVIAPLQRSGVRLADLEVLQGSHYAQTLAAWHRRFQDARSEFAQRLGERFCRMWEFYLQASEASFRWGDLVVLQAQMVHKAERLPATRDYLYRHVEPPRLAQRRARAPVTQVQEKRA